MKQMKTLKQVCRKNWYIIAPTLLLAMCSEVLAGTMLHDSFIWSYGPYEFYVRLALLFPMLVAACLITYFTACYFDSKHSLKISVIASIGCLLYIDVELNYLIPVDYGFFMFCFMTAIVSLAYYYVNNCKNSAKKTVRYTLMITFLALLTLKEAEFYIILATHIFLFITNYKSFEKVSVNIINWISAGLFATVFIGVISEQIISGMRYIRPDEEEAFILIKEMMSTLKPFGKSEVFDEALANGYVSRVFEIFGYYGYVVGIAMVILFVLFTVSILVGCFRSQGKMKLAVQVAAVIFAIRTFTSVLEVFGIFWFYESSIMFASLNSGEFTVVGVIIGLIFAVNREKPVKIGGTEQSEKDIQTENKTVIDIHSKGEYPSCALSNFAEYEFYVDGIKCASMESFLQSLKFRNIEKQTQVCQLSGSEAKKSTRRSFAQLRLELTRIFYWQGKPMNRFSDEYQKLLDKAYSELSKNEEFIKALKSSGENNLVHSAGKRNTVETILTEYEFVSRLERARQNIMNKE